MRHWLADLRDVWVTTPRRLRVLIAVALPLAIMLAIASGVLVFIWLKD